MPFPPQVDRPGVRQVLEGSGEQGKKEETGCELICGVPNDFRGCEIDDDDDDSPSIHVNDSTG